jgi:hypothetical protein
MVLWSSSHHTGEKVRQLLFTVTAKDCELQFYRGTGKGGQKRNKTSSAVRIIHKESGARGECQEHREQTLNKQTAFKRMAESHTFQAWAKIKAYGIMGVEAEIQKRVDDWMNPHNIIVEVKDDNGNWIAEVV